MPKKQQGRSRGQIIPKGTGKFLVRVFLGRDETGTRKYTSATVEGTKADAEKALTKLQAGSDDQTVVAKSKVTLAAHLTTWLAGRVDLAEKTRMDYQHRMDKDVIPFLGSKPISGISRDILQALVGKLQKDRQLSSRTIKYTMVVLSQALEDAVINTLLAKNPAKYVKLPKAEHTEATVLTPDQMQLFLERTSQGDVQRHALWTLLLTSGIRPQEACALKWEDITVIPQPDGTETGSITVVRALKKVDTSKWEVGEVKTKAGKRTIPVPPETLQALKVHRSRQSAEILRAGPKYTRSCFVFASRKHTPGAFLDIGTVRRWWKAALAEAKLPSMKLYSSRHSHLTALLAAGVHPKVAQERAGHSNIQVTMNTYSHVLPGMQQQASDLVGGLLFKRAAGSAH